MKLNDAQRIASELVELLRPACERIEVAGGVRRRKVEPHDIEIVAHPRFVQRQVDMFTEEVVPETDAIIEAAKQAGIVCLDPDVKRDGPRYKRFLHHDSHAVVELFLVHDPDQWGAIFAVRTGPAEFGRLLVTSRAFGGAMPVGMRLAGGWLMKDGQRITTREERDYFWAIGRVPCWPPAERTEERLRAWLRSKT